MGTDRLIYIRTDGNHHIASGHLMRCFSIAGQCRRLGMQVCFLVSDEESLKLLEGILASEEKNLKLPEDIPASGGRKAENPDGISELYPSDKEALQAFSLLQLKSAQYDDPDRELPEIIKLLTSQNDISVINQRPLFLLDSYYVTERYLRSLSPLVKTAYLDDLQLFDYPVDLLINYDVIPNEQMPLYKAAYQKAGRLLLGASYAPLRSQFQIRAISVSAQVRHILITTGGSDPCHFCRDFVRRAEEIFSSLPFNQQGSLSDHSSDSLSAGQSCAGEITFHIVIGKLNADRDILYSLAEKLPFMQLHENVSDMASLMMCCDLAVSAAGTTLYELCALGVPTVSFTMADNQLPAARAFHQAGAIPCAGDLRRDPEAVMKKVMDFIKDSTFSTRESAHKTMRQLVDGNGAYRIARALESL